MLVLHRQSPNQARELAERAWARVEQKLAGRKICARCGATYADFENVCETAGDCPGQAAINAAWKAAMQEEERAA